MDERSELNESKRMFLERLRLVLFDKYRRVITEFDSVPECTHPDYPLDCRNIKRFECLTEQLESGGYIRRGLDDSGLSIGMFGANGAKVISLTRKGFSALEGVSAADARASAAGS